MNKNLNLVEKLRYCPNGEKFWDSKYGSMRYCYQSELLGGQKILVLADELGCYYSYNSEGKLIGGLNPGEMRLFPSKSNHDWGTSDWSKPKAYSPKIGEDVIVSDDGESWRPAFYSGMALGVHRTGAISKNGMSGALCWRYIIPRDKFDINNLEESLKYDINKIDK